jgi:hypothetical protein
MDVSRIILELRYELRQIDEAIRSLERMGSGTRLRPVKHVGTQRLAVTVLRQKPQEIRSKPAPSRTMSAASLQP